MTGAAIWSLWWVWLAAGLVLAIVEVLVPGFVFLGFAIGAAGTGLFVALAPISLSLPGLLVLFAALSLLAWAVLRRAFRLPGGQVRVIKDDINK